MAKCTVSAFTVVLTAHNFPIVSSDLKIISGKNFILIGTPAGDEIKDPSRKPSVFISVNGSLLELT